MIKVLEVDLGQLGVRLPREEVGMVMAQPYLVHFTSDEPFTLLPDAKQRALECIDETLAVARRCSHGLNKTHFTIFPECSLPGLEGVDRVANALMQADWPTETVVIGGADALTRGQFLELLQRDGFEYDNVGNSLERIRDDQWINCSLTWVKLANGEVRCWVQPKLEPAWVEADVPVQSMFKGRSIYLFNGTYADSAAPYRFATLLCFDWIGSAGGRRMWQWLLQGIDKVAAGKGATLPLSWLFVAQSNPKPSHHTFMEQVGPFFDPAQFHSVNRASTCLVMANVAGRQEPGKAEKYGRSAVIFTRDKFEDPHCLPTYCNGGEQHRPGNLLDRLRDAVFRERGACIHSFIVRNPDGAPPGLAGRRHALAEATVHPLANTKDPRTPSGFVPAVVKWVNDDLDEVEKSLAAQFAELPLVKPVREAHKKTVASIRESSPPTLCATVFVASASTRNNQNADSWTDRESGAITHLLRTLTILEVAQYAPIFHGLGAHATIHREAESIEVVAVVGRSHEDCDKHIAEKGVPRRGPLLLVSRDEENTSWDSRLDTIFNQASGATSREYTITDPNSAVIHIGYQDILQAYRKSANEVDLKGAIDAALS